MPIESVQVLDTTLFRGTHRAGVEFTIDGRIAVAKLLDKLGVTFIEVGEPGGSADEDEFLAQAAAGEIGLMNATMVAHASLGPPDVLADADPRLEALGACGLSAVTLSVVSDVRHVEHTLRSSPEQNLVKLNMAIRLLIGRGLGVLVDCEHFFDGYHADAGYCRAVLETCHSAGALSATLCDTNGGVMPLETYQVVTDVVAHRRIPIGVQIRTDTGCAVANTLLGAQAGATLVQCAVNGYGERVGFADTIAVLGGLVTKLGFDAVLPAELTHLVEVATRVAELAGQPPNTRQPYVGPNSFDVPVGVAAEMVARAPELFRHIDPAIVGNVVTSSSGASSK